VNLAAGSGAEFPNPTGGNYFVATFYDQATKTITEIVHVTARSGDTCTIVRAQEGTVAGTWNAGDIFANLVTAGTLNAFVQAGTGPANTSVVYVGTDTSATPNQVIANTNPVPASLATGMLFNIKIANTNTGAVTLALNGGAAIAATRIDGSPLIGGDIVASEEVQFIYNGVNFNTQIPNIPQHPPQTTFYVNPAGNDSNSGFANTPSQAFATLYGAISAISTRYISQSAITIRVADGTYIGGAGTQGGYIAKWIIIGDNSNPGACIIDATTLSPPAGAVGGTAFIAGAGSTVTMSGFTFKSYYGNAGASWGGNLNLYNCNCTGPVAGSGCLVANFNGTLNLYGTINFTADSGGTVTLGYVNAFVNDSLTVNVTGGVTVQGTVWAQAGGMIELDPTTTFTGTVPTGPKYYCMSGGGVNGEGAIGNIPGSAAGVVLAPGWIS
jgi:hypothetical protein